jgi:hypothetical protein
MPRLRKCTIRNCELRNDPKNTPEKRSARVLGEIPTLTHGTREKFGTQPGDFRTEDGFRVLKRVLHSGGTSVTCKPLPTVLGSAYADGGVGESPSRFKTHPVWIRFDFMDW